MFKCNIICLVLFTIYTICMVLFGTHAATCDRVVLVFPEICFGELFKCWLHPPTLIEFSFFFLFQHHFQTSTTQSHVAACVPTVLLIIDRTMQILIFHWKCFSFFLFYFFILFYANTFIFYFLIFLISFFKSFSLPYSFFSFFPSFFIIFHL